ncbi:MAG TPA: hypothetical protein DGD08_08400 [Gemmatimonas aurantiaca]|uniref:Uncharacterized protein n=2 Tax=Gemmatimonas aurantiaca TaxID=173480 RepID=C1A471_GEMAT|nr:hypothetical protein [Gemmatimonas aurantiaca]BAH38896.1 hypothetical protein GAU_1854 [Gemmatimonas aurantiaca T-27]HCT57218.1 hypothetical protein [Gemmatimonas aurantiaca]
MTPFPDPPGEDHRETHLSMLAEQREARVERIASDMVDEARSRTATDLLALRWIANEFEDSPERTRAFELLLDRIFTERRAAEVLRNAA